MRRAFQDAQGMWWIFREDDMAQCTPLGPFFTKEFAEDTEREVRMWRKTTPMPPPLSHPQPVRPFKTPKKLRFA